jgi:hypothetical protein
MSIVRGVIIGMGVMLGAGAGVMAYQLVTEGGPLPQRIASAVLGCAVAVGIGWGLSVAWGRAS